MKITITPKNGKYLTEKDLDSYSDYLYELYGFTDDTIRNVTFIVTEQCQLKCTYCYEQNKSDRMMPLDVVRKGVDLLFDKNKLNGYFDPDCVNAYILDFIGGEPLLAIDIIDYATEYFKWKVNQLSHSIASTYRVSISSNGVAYFDPKVQDYLERNRGTVSMGISVDGNQQLHDSCRIFPNGEGSYHFAAPALKHVLGNNPTNSTKMTLCPENIAYTFEAIKSLYLETNIHFVNANCVFEDVWNNSHAEIFYSELIKLADYIIDNDIYNDFYCSLFAENLRDGTIDFNKNWCGGNGQMLAIGINGDCYPCVRYAPISLNKMPPLILGNVFDGLMMTEKQRHICDELCSVTLTTQSTDECINCKVASGCALCSGFNYDEFGTPNKRATYICEMHKVRVKANEYFWNKLKRKVI